jgi:trigger factor
MAYNLNHRANHTVEIDAELEAEAVEVERKQIIQQFRQQARVPGFRPGKAPVSAIRARFGSEIQSELQEQLTGRLLREVFEAEEDLHPLSNPRVSDLEFDDGGAFRFKASLEVRPHYELPSIDGLELPEVSLDVADAELDAELERFAEENATWEPADDDQAADGMLVEADLNGEMEDSDEEPYHEDNARFVLGEASVPPQINEALQAAKVGEQRFAERRFDDDDDNKQRAGKTVRYTIDVKALKRKVLPAVDDELAKTVGLESLDELKQRITEALQRNKRAQQRETWRRFVLDHMEEGIDTGELPPSLVQSAVGEDLNRFAYSMAMQGMAPDSAEVDWQEMAAKFEPGARTRVLDTLIAEQLADEWEVRVPEAEVDAVVTTEAQRQGLPPAEHKANLAKEGQLDSLRHSARISATIDEMIRRAGGEVE